MIWDAFANFWYGIFDSFFDSMPSDDPFDVAQQGASWEIFTTMNYFLPVSELLGVFAAIFLMGGPMLVTTLTVWLLVGVARGGNPRA